MSNTPTESEFDKSLTLPIDMDFYKILWSGNPERSINDVIYDLKLAVDKNLIGEDIEFEYIPYTEIHSDYSETIRRIADFAGVMACSVCKTIENDPDGHVCEIENRRKQQQRKALYGGDKK